MRITDEMKEKALGANAAEVVTARSAFDPESPQASSVLQHDGWTRNSLIVRRDNLLRDAAAARKRFSERHSHYHAAQFIASVYAEAAEVFHRRLQEIETAMDSSQRSERLDSERSAKEESINPSR